MYTVSADAVKSSPIRHSPGAVFVIKEGEAQNHYM